MAYTTDNQYIRFRKFLPGILVSNFVGFLAAYGTIWLVDKINKPGTLGSTPGLFAASQLLIIPLGIGVVSAYFWKKLSLKPASYAAAAFFNTLAILVESFVFLREGTICLIIVSPLLFLLIWAGSLLGRSLLARNPWISVSLAPLVLVAIITDLCTTQEHSSTVVDEVHIDAPPARVWKYIPQYTPITAPPEFWMWRIGLPMPVQSRADGPYIGARRECVFTGNVIYKEKITEVKPAELLTFNVTEQPTHPEIVGHFSLDRGRFELLDNGDGTTTLRGTSWYRLRIHPTAYFDLWTRAIIRNVHWRVMYHIKHLAQAGKEQQAT